MQIPTLPFWLQGHFSWIYRVLVNKYGFDTFNQRVFADGGRRLAQLFFSVDANVLDDRLIDGSGRRISWLSSVLRRLQSGLIYQYALLMVLSVIIFLLVFSL